MRTTFDIVLNLAVHETLHDSGRNAIFLFPISGDDYRGEFSDLAGTVYPEMQEPGKC